VAIIAISITLMATACDWSQAGGDGSRSFDNAGDTSFSPASLATLAPRWSVAAGDRFSQPVVAAGAIYLTANDAIGVKVVSLVAATGATRWTRVLPSATSAAADLAPAVAAGLVFVTTDGALAALDTASGATRWSVPNRTIESPIVDSGLVYLGPTAFDVDTGAVRWNAPAGTAIEAVSGGQAFVTSSFPCTGSPAGGSVMALDATTGAELWGRHLDGDEVFRLVVSDGSVLIVLQGCLPLLSGLDGLLNLDAASGATLAWVREAIDWNAAAHGLVLEGTTAFHAIDGSLAWRANALGCTGPGSDLSVVVAGTVVFTSNGWQLCGFDVDTGSQLGHWTFAPASDSPLALIAADGCVYATSESAGVDSINALCVTS
jgi:outer membrane protein assembly factor BamB